MKSNLNKQRIKAKNEYAQRQSQFILDNQILKDTQEYVPRAEGYLFQSAVTHSRLGEGSIRWRTPYARRLYYGTGLNFSQDKHSKATSLWFEASKSVNKRAWVDVSKRAFSNFWR